VVDLDPQMADLSLVLGVDKLRATYTSRELMLHPEREFAPVKLDEYLDLVPADPDPVLTEMRLGKETMVSGPVKLRRALDRLADRYDYILCDCRPGGGAVMANALVACRQIVAPVQLTRFAASCIVELSTILSEVSDLTSALQGNSQAAIARQIDRVEAAYQKMLDARGETGARAQRAQLAQSRLTAESEQVTIMASNVMDTDIAAAAQQFQQTQVVLQAGLSATAAIGQLSLFDYL
jgi:hypothetical protein